MAAGCRPDLERGNLLPPRPDEAAVAGARRPADVFIPSWRAGSPAALDLAVTSPQRQAALQLASKEVGAAAKLDENHKRQYLDTESQYSQQGISFLPVVAERSGGWGPSGLKVLRQFARKAEASDGKAASVHTRNYLEGLCVALRRAAARAVLKRRTGKNMEVPNAQDTARTMLSA